MKKLLYIGNKLEQHGFNKTTIETLGPLLEKEGFEVIYASTKRNFVLRCCDMLLTIIKHRATTNYILIDTYSTKAFWYAFLCSQLGRVLKLKYIPILHGGNLPDRIVKNKKISQLIFNNAYVNVAPSSYLVSAFERNGFHNVIHIPNAIELANYIFKKRIAFEPNLLWVRAFAKIYNPKMAIDVLELVQKTYPKASLTMVGPDKDGSLIATKAYADEKKVLVNFTGQLAKEAWWQLAASHDIFINTTNFDNMPVSLLEAMALGLPIVSTNVGGITFLVTHTENALLVPENDAAAMVQQIITIVHDNHLGTHLVTNAKILVNSYDWQQINKKWIALLK